MGGFMLLIVYTKIYATYKGNKCERTFLLSGICSIHTAKLGTSKRFEEI